MFCKNCGTENTHGAKFCKGCGKPLGTGENQKLSQVVDKIKAMPKKGLGVGLVALVGLIVIICALQSMGRTIKLDKYLVVETEGYDGYGTASVNIDWDAIEKKYGSKMSFKSAAKNELGGFINMMTPVDALQEYVSVTAEKNSGLSNGEVITYTWSVNEEFSKYIKCKVKCKDGSFKISGLTKVGTFDAFADLMVEFSGVAPNGSANLNYTGSEMRNSDYNCDKTSGLSNGDTVKVIIDENAIEYYAKNLGKVPAELEKEYKVAGLESYLSKISEIDESALKSMQQQASDVYNAKVAQDWEEGESLESFTYLGNYLLTAKDKDSWGTNNYLYLIYKAQVKNYFSNDGEVYDKLNDIYWYIRYEDLKVNGDGTVNVDVTDYRTPNDQFTVDSGLSDGWWEKSWYYYGYETLEELYKEVVTSNIDSYNHEDNVGSNVSIETVKQDELNTAVNGGYIFAKSDTVLLKKEELQGLSAKECKIARNEIYARHGRKFKDKELQAYFDSCDWYKGTVEPDDFEESDLSETEIANKDLIVAYEEEKGYR